MHKKKFFFHREALQGGGATLSNGNLRAYISSLFQITLSDAPFSTHNLEEGAEQKISSTCLTTSVIRLCSGSSSATNFHGWRRVWGEPGENRGGTGGEPGENRGRPKEPGENRGIWEENRGRTGGFWYSFAKSTGGEAGALGQEPGENRGGGDFL